MERLYGDSDGDGDGDGEIQIGFTTLYSSISGLYRQLYKTRYIHIGTSLLGGMDLN